MADNKTEYFLLDVQQSEFFKPRLVFQRDHAVSFILDRSAIELIMHQIIQNPENERPLSKLIALAKIISRLTDRPYVEGICVARYLLVQPFSNDHPDHPRPFTFAYSVAK